MLPERTDIWDLSLRTKQSDPHFQASTYQNSPTAPSTRYLQLPVFSFLPLPLP